MIDVHPSAEQLTAFRIGNVAVSRERRALLESPGALCTVPLLEPLPRYKSVDWSLSELARRVASSPFRLAHLFRDIAGMPVHRYHLLARLSAALD